MSNEKRCEEEMEIYSRPCGYMQRVSGWNPGKKEEFRLRKTFDINKAANSIPDSIFLYSPGDKRNKDSIFKPD